MTIYTAIAKAGPSNGSAVIEHVLSTSRYLDLKEIEKYVLAADMGLFDIDLSKLGPARKLEPIEVVQAEAGIARDLLAEGQDVMRFKEGGAVASLDRAADGHVAHEFGGTVGLYGPDQPFDPDDPINPWASDIRLADEFALMLDAVLDDPAHPLQLDAGLGLG